MDIDPTAAAATLANRRKPVPFTCEQCGKAFLARPTGQDKPNRPRYCSDSCRYTAINERRKAQRAAEHAQRQPSEETPT